MFIPSEYLLSDLLKHRVRCNKGIDHGIGVFAWMHPPVHRILGWASKPSSLKLGRNIWRLNQLKGISNLEVFVKGNCSETDQATLERLPTLLYADVLNKNGDKLGTIADFVFDPITGNIFHYLVSRSDPRIPGTSRWRLTIDLIDDQQPGFIFSTINSLNDLPLSRSSLRQDILSKSQHFRDQLQEISNKATDRLEGWLEDPPWEEEDNSLNRYREYETDPLDDWDDNTNYQSIGDSPTSSSNFQQKDSRFSKFAHDEDPWV